VTVIVFDKELDGFLPQALEQEWTVAFIVENIQTLPTDWIYASLEVCRTNWYLSYSGIVRRELEVELAVRQARDFH
jgi:hypothetical protein